MNEDDSTNNTKFYYGPKNTLFSGSKDIKETKKRVN
jgi:hypothetical protein